MKVSKKVVQIINIVLILVLIACIYDTGRYYESTTVKLNGLRSAQVDAKDFVEASDYLTEQARLYVATSNKENLNNYFNEVNQVQRRERAIRRLTDGGGEGKIELMYLKKSYELSETLTIPEIHALKLMAVANGVSRVNMSKQLLDYELTEEELALKPREAKERAYELVYGSDYAELKSDITKKISLCTELLLTNVEELELESVYIFNRQIAVLYILGFLILITALIQLLGNDSKVGRKVKEVFKNNNQGFTVLEVAIVIIIVAILIGVLAPSFLKYVNKSRDAKCEQNAIAFRKATELVIVDGVINDKSGNISHDMVQAVSTLVKAPSDNTPVIKEIYDSLNIRKEKFETIALVKDSQVFQVTYKDYRSKNVYVWYTSSPEGSELQASEYQTATNEWHVFKSKKDDSWVSMYSRNADIAWNGYIM